MAELCTWWESLAGELSCADACTAAEGTTTYEARVAQCPDELAAMMECAMLPAHEAGWTCQDSTFGQCPVLGLDFCAEKRAAIEACG